MIPGPAEIQGQVAKLGAQLFRIHFRASVHSVSPGSGPELNHFPGVRRRNTCPKGATSGSDVTGSPATMALGSLLFRTSEHVATEFARKANSVMGNSAKTPVTRVFRKAFQNRTLKANRRESALHYKRKPVRSNYSRGDRRFLFRELCGCMRVRIYAYVTEFGELQTRNDHDGPLSCKDDDPAPCLRSGCALHSSGDIGARRIYGPGYRRLGAGGGPIEGVHA